MITSVYLILLEGLVYSIINNRIEHLMINDIDLFIFMINELHKFE